MSKSLGNFMRAQGRARHAIPADRRPPARAADPLPQPARLLRRPPRRGGASRSSGSTTVVRNLRWARGRRRRPPTGADEAERAALLAAARRGARRSSRPRWTTTSTPPARSAASSSSRAPPTCSSPRTRKLSAEDLAALGDASRTRSSSCSACSGVHLRRRAAPAAYPYEVVELARDLAGYDGRRPGGGRRRRCSRARDAARTSEGLGGRRRRARRARRPRLRDRGHAAGLARRLQGLAVARTRRDRSRDATRSPRRCAPDGASRAS